jgi:hypothetical protein
MIERRHFIATVLCAAPAYALLGECRANGLSADRRLSARIWIDHHEELARGLRSGAVSLIQWSDAVSELAAKVEIENLLAEIGRSKISDPNKPFMKDPVKRRIRFLDDQGMVQQLNYAVARFDFGAQNVITPHGHKHMVSAHMVLAGKVRIRTFDRVRDLDDALVIRPSGDHIGTVGSAAAMTSAKDNIHWFTPVTASASTLDVIIDGLDKGADDYLIQPIDPLAGKSQPDGTIIAPILSFEDSMNRYSAQI